MFVLPGHYSWVRRSIKRVLLVVGYVVERFHSWAWPFYVMAGVFAFGVVMWLLVDPYRSVLENELSA